MARYIKHPLLGAYRMRENSSCHRSERANSASSITSKRGADDLHFTRMSISLPLPSLHERYTSNSMPVLKACTQLPGIQSNVGQRTMVPLNLAHTLVEAGSLSASPLRHLPIMPQKHLIGLPILSFTPTGLTTHICKPLPVSIRN